MTKRARLVVPEPVRVHRTDGMAVVLATSHNLQPDTITTSRVEPVDLTVSHCATSMSNSDGNASSDSSCVRLSTAVRQYDGFNSIPIPRRPSFTA